MTTYVCAQLVENACQVWTQTQPFLPELTDDVRDELLKWIIGCFISVFVARRVIRLFGGG